jgi:hypothetical protein
MHSHNCDIDIYDTNDTNWNLRNVDDFNGMMFIPNFMKISHFVHMSEEAHVHIWIACIERDITRNSQYFIK